MKKQLQTAFATVLAFACCLCCASNAYAQPGVIAENVEVGASGYIRDSNFGSISSPTTSDGYTYVRFQDWITAKGGYQETRLGVSGFTSDPGRNWLVSATAYGLTLNASSATYTYLNGVATWHFGLSGPLFNKGTPANFTILHNGNVGYLNLKYQILGVDYAPPGAQSSVTYSTNAMRGTAVSNSSTFNNTTTVTIAGDTGANLFGIVQGGLTGTFSSSYSQERGTTSSISVEATSSNTDVVRGPSSSAQGINHDADVIWVWLNPIVIHYVGPNNTIAWQGYAFNGADDAHVMEVIPLFVAWLKNPSLMPSDVAARLARSWDISGLGGLTSADFAQIAAADPFVLSASYNPATDANKRFDLVSGSTIPYVPASPGLQPITTQGNIATQTTTSQGQNAKHTYSTGFTLEFSSKIDFIASFASSIKVADTYTTTNSWSSTINDRTGATASYSVTGPVASDNYMGPVLFQVWRDNIYGTFMFYPVR